MCNQCQSSILKVHSEKFGDFCSFSCFTKYKHISGAFPVQTGRRVTDETREKMRRSALVRPKRPKNTIERLKCFNCERYFEAEKKARRKYCSVLCSSKASVGRKAWNSGLSKEISHSVAQQSRTLKNTYTERGGVISSGFSGHSHTPETKEKISKKSIVLNENRHKDKRKIVKCIECGNEIKITETAYSNGYGRYCNRKCKSSYQKHDPKIKARAKAIWELHGDKIVVAMLEGLDALPTRPEKKLLELIQPMGFRYTGNGEMVIAKKCPDFVHVMENKIIELLGCYWHGCRQCFPETKREDDFEKRAAHFAKYGFISLPIWEHEMRDTVSLAERIRTFVCDGFVGPYKPQSFQPFNKHRICATCGRQFESKYSVSTCSKECQFKLISQKTRGKRIERPCAFCGTLMYLVPSRLDVRYCGKDCRIKGGWNKNNPRFMKKSMTCQH